MPYLRIETNVPESKVPAGLEKELCRLLATLLNKDLNVCCVNIVSGQKMSFGGGDDPCIQGVLRSIGSVGVLENKKISAGVTSKLTSSLGVQSNRICIHVIPITCENTCYEGTTMVFHDEFHNLAKLQQ